MADLRFHQLKYAALVLLTGILTASPGHAETDPISDHRDQLPLFSPDHKFEFVLPAMDSGLVLNDKDPIIRIYEVTKTPGKEARTLRLKLEYWDYQGFQNYAWIPGRGHALVLAAKKPDGRAYLAYWNGGRKLNYLRLGTLNLKNEDPDREFFELEKISKDGRYLTYRHDSMDSEKHVKIRLPD